MVGGVVRDPVFPVATNINERLWRQAQSQSRNPHRTTNKSVSVPYIYHNDRLVAFTAFRALSQHADVIIIGRP